MKLENRVSENKLKHENEIKRITNEFKGEIKAWKKDLTSERKEKIKLEKEKYLRKS